MGWLLVGIVLGWIGGWIYHDREGFRDRLTGTREAAAEVAQDERTAEAGKAVLTFVRRYWWVLLIVVVLAAWGISTLIQQANQVPQVHLGLNQFTDKCGVSVTVDLTVEDVHRGYFTVGSTAECRRIVNLKPGQ